MIRIFIAACAALAAPAAAQQTPAALPTQGQLQPEQMPPARSIPTSSDVAQIVATEFPAHDTDRNGLLDIAEFSRWLRALRAASPGQPAMAEADLQAWTVAAFTQADADLNKGVDPAEMAAFLKAR